MVMPASGPRATGLGRLCCWSEPQATGLGVRLRPSVLFSGLNHEPQGSGFVCDLCLVLTKVVRWQLWPSYARNYLSHWHWPFMALALARIARFRIVHGHTPINRPAAHRKASLRSNHATYPTPLLARRGFPLALRVGACWVSTPSSMPRLGAQFLLFARILRGTSAISASGQRCHVAHFSHWRPPLRPLLHTHRVLRVVVVSSSTCCCHLRLRPNSEL